jgi:selenophosphate synthetase-related protein
MSENQEYKPVEMEEAVGVPVVGEQGNTVASVKAVSMIEVVAPATLPECYAFEAQVGDRVFTVTVVSCA